MPDSPIYRTTRFANGLVLATAEMPYMASACVGLWTKIGSRYEPPRLNGITHFIEHLLFKGTNTRTSYDISLEIESLGGHINAWTSEESTCFYAIASAKYFQNLIDVLMDMFHFSKFSKTDIDKEREVVKEEIAMYRDQPNQHVEDLLNEALWNNHPLGRPITGTEQTVNNLTREKLIKFKNQNYGAQNSFLVVAGSISHNDAVEKIKKYLQLFVKKRPPKYEPANLLPEKLSIRLCTRKVEQTNLALAFRTCSRHDPRRYAIRVLNAIVAENMTSRLFRLLRDDIGIVYNIYSSPSFFDDVGDFTILAGMDEENIFKAIQLILKELRKIKAKPPSKREVETAKNYLIGQLELSLESTENHMNWLGEQLVGYNTIIASDEVVKNIMAVTPEDLQQVAIDFIKPQKAAIALVSSLKSDKGLLDLFKIIS
ncbi:MAG: M16 family metallopeptidase [Verrucomicrobiia bacterium]